MKRRFMMDASTSSISWLSQSLPGSVSLQNSRPWMSRSTESSSPISGPSMRSIFQSLLNVTQDWSLQISDIPSSQQLKTLVNQAPSSHPTLPGLTLKQQRVIPLKRPQTFLSQRLLCTKNLNLHLLSSKTLHSMTTMSIGITSSRYAQPDLRMSLHTEQMQRSSSFLTARRIFFSWLKKPSGRECFSLLTKIQMKILESPPRNSRNKHNIDLPLNTPYWKWLKNNYIF